MSFRFRGIQVFEICKLTKWWLHEHQPTPLNFDQRYLSQFLSEIFDPLNYDSIEYAPQYKLINSFTIETCWFPELPGIKSFSGRLLPSILIFASRASNAPSSKNINTVDAVCRLVKCFMSWKSLTYWNQTGGDWKTVNCLGNISLELLVYQFLMVPAANLVG